MTFLEKLKVYHSARYPFLFIQTHEEVRVCTEMASIVVGEQPNPGDITKLYHWDCLSGLMELTTGTKYKDTQDPVVAIMAAAELPFTDGLFVFKDVQLYNTQRKAELIRATRNAIPYLISKRNMVTFVSAVFPMPVELERYIQIYNYKLPTEEELAGRVDTILASTNARRPPEKQIVIPDDIKSLVSEAAKGMTGFEADNAFCKAFVETKKFNRDMVDSIFEEKVATVKKVGFLQHLKSDVGFEDIGGLHGLKKWISLRKKSFTPQARAFGLPPSKGMILAGIQGCGKTLLAKAVSKEFGFPLFIWDIASCFQRYVGDSEANVRKVIETIEALGKCVVLIDELEGAFNAGAASGQSDTGTSSRVFSTVLTWLSERTSPAFLIGTSNNFMAFPPQFVRPGRWDQSFWIDLPTTLERRDIFKIILKRYKQDPSKFNLEQLADKTKEFTGSEIEKVVLAGMYHAFDGTKKLNNEDILGQIKLTKPQSVIHATQVTEMRRFVADKLMAANDEGEVTPVEALLKELDTE